MATYWNGEPCKAERVVVVVADNPDFRNYWARRCPGGLRCLTPGR